MYISTFLGAVSTCVGQHCCQLVLLWVSNTAAKVVLVAQCSGGYDSTFAGQCLYESVLLWISVYVSWGSPFCGSLLV